MIKFLMLLLFLGSDVFAGAIVGANHLRYTHIDRPSYKLWLSVSEQTSKKTGVEFYTQYEDLWNGSVVYADFKPYYKVDERLKVNIQFAHDSWQAWHQGERIGRERIGVGVEYRLWD